MKKLSLIVAVALGTLVAGSMAIAQDAGTNAPKKRMMMRMYQSPEQRLESMTTQLNLTAEQRPKLKAVFEDEQKKMQTIREDTDAKMKGILSRFALSTVAAGRQQNP
jgi:Spy/CpxP family protein refolding chaperone